MLWAQITLLILEIIGLATCLCYGITDQKFPETNGWQRGFFGLITFGLLVCAGAFDKIF